MAPRLALLALVVALAGATGTAKADNPALTGVVGTNDGFTLTLSGPSGAVKHLDPGTYTLVVHDQSTFHNFHLFGPGVDVATVVEETGDRTFTVALTDGVYTFQCDPHQSAGMKGTFAVGSATLPQPAPVAKLTGTITGSRATLAGTAGLTAGKATITIADKSKTDGFLLQGPGVAKKSGVAFTGKVTWTVTLRPGKYVYGSVKSPKARRSFVVSPA